MTSPESCPNKSEKKREGFTPEQDDTWNHGSSKLPPPTPNFFFFTDLPHQNSLRLHKRKENSNIL